jgi:hypothetical protein
MHLQAHQLKLEETLRSLWYTRHRITMPSDPDQEVFLAHTKIRGTRGGRIAGNSSGGPFFDLDHDGGDFDDDFLSPSNHPSSFGFDFDGMGQMGGMESVREQQMIMESLQDDQYDELSDFANNQSV